LHKIIFLEEKIKMKRKILVVVLAVFTVAAVFAGGQKEAAPPTAASASSLLTDTGLPLSKEPVTLRMFMEIDQSKIGVHTATYANLLCFQELAKITNVTINFIHPPAGMAAEQVNLMMAAGDLPDITYWNWNRVPGGPTKAILDNIILPLNDIIPQNPFYPKLLKDDPALEKNVKTDEGYYYCYPLVYRPEQLKVTFGYMIRKDWLDKLGLSIPETMDEWYTTLTAFRDRDPNGNGKRDEIPLVSTYGKGMEEPGQDAIRPFYAAWGKFDTMYTNNGRVFFGAYEPDYKEYLLTIRKWIAEGLIDPNFSTLDTVQADAAMLNGISGVCRDGLGLGLDKFYAHFKSAETVIAVPFPTLVKGAKAYNFMAVGRDFSGSGAALSPRGKNNTIAAKWLDYLYNEDASILLNFGVEGKTFNWINGYPQLADEIVHNPNKESVNVALGRYAIGVSVFPFVNDPRVREQRLVNNQAQKDAINLWNQSDISRVMPLVTFLPEESQELANIMSEVNTFMKEYTLGFLLGRRDINREFNGYINTLKSMGIERAIQINQIALDRYNTR
jgi:putative aldouronate transport system substrate-binding protein